jgi:hypothetical protein
MCTNDYDSGRLRGYRGCILSSSSKIIFVRDDRAVGLYRSSDGRGREFLVSIFQASAVTRAKGRFKARVCKSIIEDRDWRARLELLSRIYPEEFARTADRPLPQEPQSKEPLLKFVLQYWRKNTRGTARFSGEVSEVFDVRRTSATRSRERQHERT